MNSLHFQLKFNRETTNKKLMWIKQFSHSRVELYMPKWRLPEIIPKIINIEIKKGQRPEIKLYKEIECKINKEKRNDPIEENLKFKKEFPNTFCYIPLTNNKDKYFDYFHISKEILSVHFEFLNIKVWWNP